MTAKVTISRTDSSDNVVVVRTEKRLSNGEWNDAGETKTLKPAVWHEPVGAIGEEDYLPGFLEPGQPVELTVYDGERFVIEEPKAGEERRGGPRVDVGAVLMENAALKAENAALKSPAQPKQAAENQTDKPRKPRSAIPPTPAKGK